MKRSRKILALALALLMIVGLFSNALASQQWGNLNDMPDAGEVSPEYVRAVGVLVGLGIIQGKPSAAGNIVDPQTPVTRAEMAGFTFRLMTGPVTPPVATGGSPFTDVVDYSWALDYIVWATNTDPVPLIVGNGDGTFGPYDDVTVVGVATFLLRALGYDRNEEFQGIGWDSRAWTRAQQVGLFAGMNITGPDRYEMHDIATREMVAQMVFNALCISRVIYMLNNYFPTGNTYGEDVYDFCHNNGVTGMVMSLGFQGDVYISPVGGDPNVDFTALTGTATPDEVGRVVDAYVRGDGSIVFLHILSEDIPVAARTGAAAADDDALMNRLGVRPGTNLADPDMKVFPNFAWYASDNGLELELDLATADRPQALYEQNAIYVLYDGEIVSAVFTNRWIANLENVGGQIYLTRLADPLTALDPSTLAGTRASDVQITAPERIINPANIPMPAPGAPPIFVNVEQLGNTFTITPVQSFTGTVTAYQHAFGTLTIDGVTRRFAVDDFPMLAPNTYDLNQLSLALAAQTNLTLAEVQNFLLAGDLTTEFTFWISGVTGAVVAVNRAPAFNEIAYILRAWTRLDDWGNPQNVAEVAYIDGTTAVIVTAPGANFQELRDTVVWLQETANGWVVVNRDVAVSTRTVGDPSGMPLVLLPAPVTPDRTALINTMTPWIAPTVLDTSRELTNSVTGTVTPIPATDGLFISSNARFVYLDVNNRGAQNAALNGTPFTATGPHVGQIAPGTTFWYVPAANGINLDRVFVIAPHQNVTAGQIVFLPGPVERHGAGVYTHIAYDALTGVRITANNGVTMSGITTGTQTVNTAPGPDGVLHVPAGFYRINVDGAGVQTLVPFAVGGAHADLGGLFYVSVRTVDSVVAAIPNVLYHINGAFNHQWLGQTVVVDLRPNVMAGVPSTSLLLEETMNVHYVRQGMVPTDDRYGDLIVVFVLP